MAVLSTHWKTAKNVVPAEDRRLILWNKNLEEILDKLEEKIEDASELKTPTDKDNNDMKTAVTGYQAAVADYLKKIVEANKLNPGSGKSWLIYHQALQKIDDLVYAMLKQDTKLKGPWTRAKGFVDKSLFKSAPVEQPPSNPKLATETGDEYYKQGFQSYLEKLQSAYSAADRAKALYPGLKTCFPHAKKVVELLQHPANTITQLVPRFEQVLAAKPLNVASGAALLKQIQDEIKKFIAALPAQGHALIPVMNQLAHALDQEWDAMKPARPTSAAPTQKPK
jgi:hypothetical protein